ncbi:hypothetical protein SOVF_024090 [Spinacia oleracea]|nr:hypothetical protein SOVF_024090 [Spinacia oleracea]
MDEIQQEEDEYEPNHDQLQFENEERVERQGGENMTPNKCRSPMSVIKEWVPVCEDDLNPKEGMEFDNLEESLYLTRVFCCCMLSVVTILALVAAGGGGGGGIADVDVVVMVLLLLLIWCCCCCCCWWWWWYCRC